QTSYAHAAAMGFHMPDELRLAAIRNVVKLEAAVRVRSLLGRAVDALAPELAHVLLDVDDHQVADDARLVAVRVGLVDRDLGEELGLARIGHVEDRGAEALLVGDVADVGVLAGDVDLPGARQLEARQALHVARELRCAGYAPHKTMIARGRGKPIHYLRNAERWIWLLIGGGAVLFIGIAVALALAYPGTPANQLVNWSNGWLFILPAAMAGAGVYM